AQGGVRVRRAYRNSRPAFAPPPPEPGAGSSRAVGRGKGPECHCTLRGPRAGEMEEGGWRGRWVGATEERRTGRQARPQSPARTPCLVGWKVAVGDEAEQGAGGSSSASSLRGADLRGSLPSARRLKRETHAGPSHGGSDDGGAPGGCAGCGSCSGATTRARRRGGVCVSELGGARRPRLGRSLCGWAGGVAVQTMGESGLERLHQSGPLTPQYSPL
ncbi:MAG: hypothetical protein QOH06_4044, partial [Acidobacteriota bacterium]|nr:hypothetical protein [Acidobacteriota bacterium]